MTAKTRRRILKWGALIAGMIGLQLALASPAIAF